MPFAAYPDSPRESRQARIPLADLARFALELGGDFGIAPQIDGQWYPARCVHGDRGCQAVDKVRRDWLAGHDVCPSAKTCIIDIINSCMLSASSLSSASITASTSYAWRKISWITRLSPSN